MNSRFGGIYAVLYALFDKAGELDFEAMQVQVEIMVQMGVAGITVLGLATEVHKLSIKEQKMLMAWISKALRGRLPFLVTVSGN